MRQSFAHTKKKAFVRYMLTAVMVILLTCVTANGSVFQGEDNVHISRLDFVDDDLYAAGNEVVVDGTITGDLMAAGYHSTVNGEVGGSANFLSRFIDHTGKVSGSLRSCGERLILSGYVGGSLLAAGNEVSFSEGAVVERDVSVAGNDISLAGVIKGNVSAAGNTIRISGLVEGDVELRAQRITIAPPAVIRGNITYTSDEEDALTILEDVTILGEISWNEREVSEEAEDEDSSILTTLVLDTSTLLAAFLFGIIIIKLFPRYVQESVDQLKGRFSVSLAAGLLVALVTIACIVALFLTLTGVLVGNILLEEGQAIAGAITLIISTLMVPISSFGSVSGGILFYSGKIIIGFWIGMFLIGLIKSDARPLSRTSLLLGLILLTIICAIPYLGIAIAVLLALTGAGAILLGIRGCGKKIPGA